MRKSGKTTRSRSQMMRHELRDRNNLSNLSEDIARRPGQPNEARRLNFACAPIYPLGCTQNDRPPWESLVPFSSSPSLFPCTRSILPKITLCTCAVFARTHTQLWYLIVESFLNSSPRWLINKIWNRSLINCEEDYPFRSPLLICLDTSLLLEWLKLPFSKSSNKRNENIHMVN